MDPVTAAKVAEFLQSGGPWGLLALSFAVIGLLWRDGIAVRAELAKVHEKRVVEVADLATRTAAGLANASATAAALAAEAGVNNALVQKLLDVVRLIPPAIETNTKQLDGNANRMERVLDKLGGRS